MYLAFYFKSYKQQRESVSSARKRFISAKAFHQRESVLSARKRFISAKAFHQRESVSSARKCV
jgi:hypothetical protein